MTNFSCIIIDDEQQAIDLLSDSLQQLYSNIKITGTYTQWAKALERLREDDFDILFLDISIQGRNGMNLLKCVPKLQSEVIFVTAYPDYALEAFRFMAGGYIVKPIDEAELANTVDKVIQRIQHKKVSQTAPRPAGDIVNKIGIPSNNAIDYVNISDIIYLQAAQAYTKVVTGHGELTSSYNIGKYKNVLDERIFYQVHRSYLINLNHVVRYETSGSVLMNNGAVIPVAKNFREDFLKLFNRVKYGEAGI